MSDWRDKATFPRASFIAAGLALVVSLPTLGLRFVADDFLHLGILRGFAWGGGSPGGSGRHDLFRFATGDPAVARGFIETGPFPWWTLPELKLAFWRPLTSAIEMVEQRVFGEAPLGYHVTSVLLYGVLALAVASLFRRVLPGPIGAVAAVLYAIDEAHFVPVAWIANRNALVAALPAVVGLILHLEWRERGRRWAAVASFGAFALALAGGESALGVFAYLGAYELIGVQKGSWARRVASLLPGVCLVLAWGFWYRRLGYGAWGSGTYLDPVRQAASYWRALPERWLTLLVGGLANVPAEVGLLPPPWPRFVLVAGFGVIASCAWGYLRIRSRLSLGERRQLAWLSLGSALSLLPVASTFPSIRLLTLPGIGMLAVIATLLVHGWRVWSRAGVIVLSTLHVAVPVVLWGLLAYGSDAVVRHAERVARSPVLDEPGIAQKRLVLLAMPDPLVGLYPTLMRQVWRLPAPSRWWTLNLAPKPTRVTRVAASRLELELDDGRFLASEFEQLFRSASFPLRQGERIEVSPELTVQVEEADARGPKRLSFAFDRPLEDPSLLFVFWSDGELRRFPMLPVGGQVVIPYEGWSAVPD